MDKHSWHKVHLNLHSSNQPSPRWGHTCCVLGNQVIYFGGYAQSVYMNDVWSFNTNTMEWTEIKTTGDVPSPRSNCSMSYDAENDRIIVFGGGGPNKKRYNTINILNWSKKEWIEITPKENEPAPWQRTYHAAELAYPYLVVYGGEGVADMDDLWAFNFLTLSWIEIPIYKDSKRPCARRFHSSAIIGNRFYIIGGCHGKYRCLSDVFSIDLTPLIQNADIESLSWINHKPTGSAFLTRWGHTSSVYDNKIYIFGGRFSNDLNDLLVMDLEKNQIKAMKTSIQLPKARRRHSACFVGSCMIIFGGFNGEYYNDLNYINVFQLKSRLQISGSSRAENIAQMINSQQLSDCYIYSEEGEKFYLHRGLLAGGLENIQQFLERSDRQFTVDELQDLVFKIYQGYGEIPQKVRAKLGITIYDCEEDYEEHFKSQIMEQGSTQKQSLSKKKCLLPTIIQLTEQQFGNFLDLNRSHTHQDCTLVINDQYVIPTNRTLLAMSSQYFRNLFSGRFQGVSEAHVKLPSTNLVIFEMMINYLLLDKLVVPMEMEIGGWLDLYEMAEFMCLNRLMSICEQHICTLVQENNIEEIFNFSIQMQAEALTLYCADYVIKCMVNRDGKYCYNSSSCQSQNTALEIMYNLSRFDILQVKLQRIKLMEDGLKIKENPALEEKQNYEIN